ASWSNFLGMFQIFPSTQTEQNLGHFTTNHCCETTARMAGNLGFDVSFILDATACFPRTDHEGKTVSADEIMRATAANLHGEFANVMTTANYVEACARNFN
ncbi:isochorismatase family protein, partial [Corynebacterium accolens]